MQRKHVNQTTAIQIVIEQASWPVFAYTPPNNATKYLFFNELTDSLNKAIKNYENILLMI